MPTKTGAKIRIIVLGTGPDAEEAREIAAADADVTIAAKFTKTVTHLIIDDTVKSSEARVKKARETGVPVLKLDGLKELLVADAAVDPEPAAEPEAESEPAEPEVAAKPEAEAEPVAEAAPAVEPEAAETPEAESAAEAVTEPEPEPEAEPEVKAEAKAEPEVKAEPEAEAATETESETDKVVPAQAEAPRVEREPETDRIDEPVEERAAQADADDETAKTAAKPGLMAKLKSIFGKTGARK